MFSTGIMEQGYTNITLVDCNRQNSEEGKSQNLSQPAQFTNKVGTGMKLGVGDKISVHSGFVSERGAGASTIEFNGKDLNDRYDLEQTYLSGTQIPADTSTATAQFGESTQPYGYGCVAMTNTATNYSAKDNEGHIEISYYKTSNGEGYAHLPRVFDFYKSEAATKTAGGIDMLVKNFDYTLPEGPLTKNSYITADWYNVMASPLYTNWIGEETSYQDCFYHGQVMPLWVGSDLLTVATTQGEAGMVAQPSMRCADDCRWFGANFINYTNQANPVVAQRWTNCNYIKPYWSPAGYVASATSYLPAPCDVGTPCGYKKKNNNTRYTLYVKELTYYATWGGGKRIIPNVDETADGVANISASRKDFFLVDPTKGSATQDSRFHRNPALSEYIRYKETKTLSLPRGHSAPSNVAEEMTNQLNRKQANDWGGDGDVKGINPLIGTTASTSTVLAGADRRTSAYKQSETFKPFGAASSCSLQPLNAYNFFGYIGVNPTPINGTALSPAASGTIGAVEYLSSYQTIGVKRPELWDATRDVCKNCYARQIGEGTMDAQGTLLTGKHPWMDIEFPTSITEHRYDERETAIFSTGILWNDDNLGYMKAWLDAQGKHPELFDDVYGTQIKTAPLSRYTEHTADNSRYIHVNQVEHGWGGGGYLDIRPGGYLNGGVTASLGGDNYGLDSISSANYTHRPINQQSRPLWVWFDKTREGILTGGDTENTLYGGYFYKYYYPTSGLHYIAFSTKYIGGLSEYFWTGIDYLRPDKTAPAVVPAAQIWGPIKAGADPHFSAYGTDAIVLYAGYTNADPMEAISGTYEPTYYEDNTNTALGGAVPPERATSFSYIKQRYIGASNPEVAFDDKASRFNFQGLHTPEYTGNPINAGIDDEVPVMGTEAGNQVYKINKRILKTEFCPDIQGYVGFFKYQTNRSAWENSKRVASVGPPVTYVYDVAKEYQNIYDFNENLERWSVFDADCGIFIEDFGVSQSKWSDSLWGILGFTWEQFNSSTIINRQYRANDVTTQTIGSSFTTNANVEGADMTKWRTNMFGAVLYNNQLPIPVAGAGVGLNIPAITNVQTSSQINAQSLPRKMIHPYFLIRSNIIGDSNYQGGDDGGQILPIVYVVNKENGFGDFYFQGTSQMEFTNTEERILTSISTSIHNPDMTLASVDNNSAIIYKITKQVNANLGVAQQILKDNNTARNYQPAVNPDKKSLYDGIGK